MSDPDSVPPTPPPADYTSSIVPNNHSNEVQQFLGERVPENTNRATETAIKIFAKFVVDHARSHDFYRYQDILPSDILKHCRLILFPNDSGGYLTSGYQDWKRPQLLRVRYYLIEFVVLYKKEGTDQDVMPTTMKGYIHGIQRAFALKWGYALKLLENDVFKCPKEGLLPVLDNKLSLMQSKGMTRRSHNVLSKDDISKLYNSASLSKSTPSSFLSRLIFDIALITALRPGSLVHLTTNQFEKVFLNGEYVFKITGIIGSRLGASKTNRGGFSAAKEKFLELIVWNRVVCGGALNIFQDIDEYLNVRKNMAMDTRRFFLQANLKGTAMKNFFKRQHLGVNSFRRIIKEVCDREGVVGLGDQGCFTAHGLRGTVITNLLESGHSDSTVAMRSGHKDISSLKSYQTLRGNEGEKQQIDIFDEKDIEQRSKKPKLESAESLGCGKDEGKELEGNEAEATEKHVNTSTVVGTVSSGCVNVTINYHK